jgi:hypothetical protein
MWVRRHERSPRALLDALNATSTWFGAGPYSGLVTPSSAVLSGAERADVVRGLAAAWEWLSGWQSLYRQLWTTEPGHPLVKACEWSLTPVQRAAQRGAALRAELPQVARLDAVTVEPNLQIAEVQWKGGGESFLAGVDAAFRAHFPLADGETPLGDLTAEWAAYYAHLTGRADGAALSVARDEWMASDRAFARAFAARGLRVRVATPAELAAGLSVRNGRVRYADRDGDDRVGLLRCERLPDAVASGLLAELTACRDAGTVVLDPPLTYLCSQKVGMALPFTAPFAAYFSDRVRRVLIPTVLIQDPPDCAVLAGPLAPHGGSALAELTRWEDVPRLPRGLRRRLVVKCGSANRSWNQGGRGVWKLGGTGGYDERTWKTVLERVRSGREPWLLQPYVRQTWPVDLSHPVAVDDARRVDGHARLLFYGRRTGDTVELMGGAANFSALWKVSGKDAGWDGPRLTGSAFADVRMGAP